MYKILFTIVVLVIGFSIAGAQIKRQNLSKSNSKQQIDYSESIPYTPREIVLTDTEKKREKKLMKASIRKKTTQANSEVPSKARSENKVVKIPLFVYDQKGEPVTDLQNSDIKIFVDDKENKLADFEPEKLPLNILLVLDTSPSLAFNKSDLRNVVSEMIKALKPEDKLQIIGFNETANVLNEPTNDGTILQKAVKKIEMGDGTSIYDVVQEVSNKYLGSNTEPPVIILLSDGVDTTSLKANYQTSLIAAEKAGIIVFPFYFDSYKNLQKIGPVQGPFVVGNVLGSSSSIPKAEYDLGRSYLQDIAALSGGGTFAVKNFSGIKKKDFEAAFKFINPQYFITLSSTETANTFQRKQIKVRINRPNLTVQARGSYIIGED